MLAPTRGQDVQEWCCAWARRGGRTGRAGGACTGAAWVRLREKANTNTQNCTAKAAPRRPTQHTATQHTLHRHCA